jgi:uncharacterized protein DUF4159
MRRLRVLAVLLLVAAPAAVWAQRNFQGFTSGRGSNAPIKPNIPYDGRFVFVRLRYGPPIAYQNQRVPWSHDYPEGEQNMMKIMNELSLLAPHIEDTNVMAFDDPEIFKYPVSYLCEPGPRFYWTDEEAANFRTYLLKGGFVIVDDFRWQDWDYFENQMRKALPEARFVDLDGTHPIFHAFFEIPHPELTPQNYDPGQPIFRGLYEDNDPKKRLMMIIAYNTDISEFWEWSGTGFRPIEENNEAFKIGVNFFMYGVTH